MCLDQVKITKSTIKVLWVNVPLILFQFCKVIFGEGTIPLFHKFITTLCTHFPTLHFKFWHHNTRKLSVWSTGHGKNACGLQSLFFFFFTGCFYLCEYEFLMTLEFTVFWKEKKKVHEKRCGLLGFSPSLILIHSDWSFGKISQQMKNNNDNNAADKSLLK